MPVTKHDIAGAVIAGGHSNRFGSEKASALLSGKTLIERVYQRLQPQVSKVWLNLPAGHKELEKIDAPLIKDITPDRNGPLAGVLSALITASDNGFEWLLIAPCDTPFIPLDLGEKLLHKCITEHCTLAIARAGGWNHPSLSIWNRSLLPSLKEAVLSHSKAGFKQFYPEINHCFAEWNVEAYDPFFNINYAQDIEAATDIINNNHHLDKNL